MHTRNQKKTSWGKVSTWYNTLVGESGHFYHQSVVLPKLLKILALKQTDKVIDLGCGEGVFERAIPKEIEYMGVDIAQELLREARRKTNAPSHRFVSANLSRPFQVEQKYTAAVCILALQNMQNGRQCIANASRALKKNGRFAIVLNHPCFRIPRQSSWEIDPKTKMQYRRVNRYLSSLEIPIQMSPGRNQKNMTWSYHNPLSEYFQWLKQNDFVVEDCQEWISKKESVGKAAKMENRARGEFPLFLCIVGRKI